VVSRPLPAWGTILLDESSASRRLDDLAGGDRHSVELTEAHNQSRKPQDPVGLLWIHEVSCGRDPYKQ